MKSTPGIWSLGLSLCLLPAQTALLDFFRLVLHEDFTLEYRGKSHSWGADQM